MKLSSFLLLLFFYSTLWLPNLKGQSWEVFFEDQALGDFYYQVAYPGPANGVRLVLADGFITAPASVFSFDENGNYIGQNTINGTLNWTLANVGIDGASYWTTFYSLKKLDINNQIVWTYDPPVSAGIFWERAAPNGGTCLQYSANNSGQVIDYVNSDGQLVKRFSFPGGWPDEYVPGHDYSMIYSDNTSSGGPIHWVKVDQNGQVVWEIDLDENIRFLTGSLADGTSFHLNNNGGVLTKLNAAGVVEWERNIATYFPGSDVSYFLGSLVRQDGSIILCIDTLSFIPPIQYTPFFVNINPSNGDMIWFKKVASTLGSSTSLSAPMIEMPDGGILACFDIFNATNDKVLLVRTDPEGNTLTNQIAGTIYRDENSDCAFQPGEPAMQQVSVIAQSGTKKYSATTNPDGHFSMATTGGDYTLSIVQPGSYWNYCDLPNPITLDASNDTTFLAIGAKATVICPEMEVSIGSPVFRRCFDNNYLSVQYHNFGTAPADNAYVEVALDPKLMYLSSTVPLFSQNGSTYTFDLGTVGIGEGGSFIIFFKVDCDATLGEILCVESHIYPDTLCIPTAERMTSNRFCLPVVASFDPNDKTAFVNGKPEIAKILPDTDLEYLIRFQNTGNDTAFNIVITDTLGSQLDPASVVPGASSHPYLFDLRNGNILRFVFNNILLPDSNTNEAASHGFVKFFIRQKTGNPIGSTLGNRAAIFFDYNDPVITNTSLLTVSSSVGTKETPATITAEVRPVPAQERVEILLPAGAVAVSWELLDVTGKVLRTGGAVANSLSIPRNGLPGGLFWCRLMLENGSVAIGKIVFN